MTNKQPMTQENKHSINPTTSAQFELGTDTRGYENASTHLPKPNREGEKLSEEEQEKLIKELMEEEPKKSCCNICIPLMAGTFGEMKSKVMLI